MDRCFEIIVYSIRVKVTMIIKTVEKKHVQNHYPLPLSIVSPFNFHTSSDFTTEVIYPKTV